MKINLTKTSLGLAAIAGIMAVSGAAKAANPDCAAAGTNPIYVTGSSAVKPFIAALATKLAGTQTIIYVSQGSCVGVDDIVNGTKMAATAGLYWKADSAAAGEACDLTAGTAADIGVSDVFATSCSGITDVPATVGDFQGPVQVMNFVVPKAADVAIQSISAEAAYLVFGFDPSTNDAASGKSYAEGTPWTSKADIWMRGPGSGTQSMLATAINVPPAAWALNATNALKGSGDMVTKIGTATTSTTIGILASNELDDHRDTIRGLAYKHYEQSCGYWPDSTSSSKDKLNVRTGRYAVWGPLHMLTKIGNDKKPSNAVAADVIAYVQGDKTLEGVDMLALQATTNVVPQCAMQVSRDAEIGSYQSVNPSCSCAYDKLRGGDITDCKTCKTDNDCKTGDKNTCSYGYCEAI